MHISALKVRAARCTLTDQGAADPNMLVRRVAGP